MKALTTTMLCFALALSPVLASAGDSADCWLEAESLSEQIKSNSASVSALESQLQDDIFLDTTYCCYQKPDYVAMCNESSYPHYSGHVYGAIGYEMRYTEQGVEADFDQRLRFAVNYFSQLSDNLSLHVGISDRFDGLPNGDPFGFQRDIAEIQRDMRVNTAYAQYSN